MENRLLLNTKALPQASFISCDKKVLLDETSDKCAQLLKPTACSTYISKIRVTS